MVYEFRLKTGFYETKLYSLNIHNKQIRMIPACADNKNKIITVSDNDLISVKVTERKSLEIEIQTKDNLYSGVILGVSASGILDVLKKELHKEVLYEGGRRNG